MFLHFIPCSLPLSLSLLLRCHRFSRILYDRHSQLPRAPLPLFTTEQYTILSFHRDISRVNTRSCLLAKCAVSRCIEGGFIYIRVYCSSRAHSRIVSSDRERIYCACNGERINTKTLWISDYLLSLSYDEFLVGKRFDIALSTFHPQ